MVVCRSPEVQSVRYVLRGDGLSWMDVECLEITDEANILDYQRNV